ncbi:UNVERIFIED_CONTAM: hypothetical protein Sradi_7289400 [Sesamum radiatum]|uniref:Uncharacterized protein n=1 Tax=Sesamum radiatum TaxID=300843 RepID=A0AAW2IJ69_SESRA
MSLEDIVKSLALTTLQFQQEMEAGLQETRIELQETRENIQFLGNQISQLAMAIDKLAVQASQGLPSQTDTHPIENVSAMTPQIGKELHTIEQAPMEAKGDEKTLDDTDTQNKKGVITLYPELKSAFYLLPQQITLSDKACSRFISPSVLSAPFSNAALLAV